MTLGNSADGVEIHLPLIVKKSHQLRFGEREREREREVDELLGGEGEVSVVLERNALDLQVKPKLHSTASRHIPTLSHASTCKLLAMSNSVHKIKYFPLVLGSFH